ncbi:MAG: carboxypeptidase-like regulatory domain-containing protein [Algicola sp.]|nr:carboxypeptidase-like regulatory domain-containing protein [Algicola sp.]
MKRNLLITYLLLCSCVALAQTKVGGYVYDELNEPVAYANVFFKDSSEGTITDENGRFYLESDNIWDTLKVTFVGYEDIEFPLKKRVNYDLKFTLKEAADALKEVVIVAGKQSKDEEKNPAIAILKKIWERKRKNGLNQFNQYRYDKYEKVEFDLNNVDSALMKSRVFKGMEFIFNEVDTSRVTGKTYLPIFINESVSEVHGDNKLNKKKEKLKGNKNSGFENNQFVVDFIEDLYTDYNIYDNYLKFFDKSFVSPISRTGINTYNYVLSDSTYIDNKWCYNIVYYPRRKNELTFKGDFWVADTTYAIKEINMHASKSANINWVKDIYIEQEFEVLNDSIFLIKRDYFMSDFSFQKKEAARGVYGKRTTLYNNYEFNKEKAESFYNEDVFNPNDAAYSRDESFWDQNRMEALSKDEKGVYAMLDTLKTVKKFKQLYNLGTVLVSGYVEFDALNLDYGPVFSTVGYNDVEGIRLRAGGRTYFGPNDMWRVEGFTAYGFKDQKVKYGLTGKWLINKENRLIVSAGYRKDVEQIGASLTTSTDILGRSLISSSIIGTGVNDKLTTISVTGAALEIEPAKNLIFRVAGGYKTLESASPTFSLDYFDEDGNIRSHIKQFETAFSVSFFPNRRMSGYGVERLVSNDYYTSLFAQVSRADKGVFGSDFDYTKVQFSFMQPWQVGGFGVLYSTIEAGKIFGEVPLGLLSVVPGNQSYFSVYNTFSQMNYYEFITDTYTTLHLQHNFNGRLFSRIPLLRKLNLREIVSVRGVWGDLSEANIAMSQPSLSILEFNALTANAIAPKDKIYWEYAFGIGNIFKVFRLDFNFRGNYLDRPDARKFGITGSFGFNF